MPIDEFARQVNSSARNVRAYLERGLLPPPRMVARTGLYDARHVQRMAVIHRLQQSGFSLEGIRVLLQTQAAGGNLEDLLGAPPLEAPPPVAADAAALFASSKFERPLLRDEHVRRDRCLALLSGKTPTHALITAPAGSGKSILAAQLLASTDRLTVWVSLDGEDNNPARFWTAVLIAIRAALTGFGDDLLAAIISGEQIEQAVGGLAAQLCERDAGLLVVLDDLHAVTDSEVMRQLEWFLGHMPASDCRVVVCSRTRPTLAVARLVMSAELTHLHTHDLRFDITETHDFLTAHLGLSVANDAARAITASVDGWASGIYRAGLSLRDGTPAQTVIAALTGSDDRVQDYFSDLELARSASDDPLSQVLESVAETILRTAGYRTVVLNLFRPQWDDYEVVLVIGGQESRDTLLGTTNRSEIFARLRTEGDERLPGLYFFAGDSPAWQDLTAVYTPRLIPPEDREAWQPQDALLVALNDTDGEPLVIVSMDEPRAGRRPTDADLHVIHAICAYAEQALRTARRGQQAMDDRRLLARLSDVSPKLSACHSRQELHDLVVETIAPHLGFERAAFYEGQSGRLHLSSHHGWDPDQPPPAIVPKAATNPQFEPAGERAGCWLLSSQDFFGTETASHDRSSDRNGRGVLAWSDHCLVIPWRIDQTQLAGVIVAQDPVDRLIPNDERRRTLRLLVDLAASVETIIKPGRTGSPDTAA
jgi:DNA-binding transcriptional MerR regulator